MKLKTADDPNGTADNPSAVNVIDQPSVDRVREQTRSDEVRRVRNIMEIGRRFSAPPEAERFVAEGRSIEEFEHFIMTEKLRATSIVVPDGGFSLGLSQRERGSYSLVKA